MPRRPRPIPLTPEEIRFRLGDWVKRHLTIVETHGPEWVTVCPACGRSKMAIHVHRKAFQCLSAHCRFTGWSPTKLVAVTLDITTAQARDLIAATAMGMIIGPVLGLETEEHHHRKGKLPLATLPRMHWGLGTEQLTYCRHRGIPDAHMRYFGLGTAIASGTGSRADYALSGRVIFPVWGIDGRMVWWVARAIRESRAKTINMPRSCREDGHEPGCVCYHEEWGLPPIPHAATADEVVLGLHLVRPGDRVIVVEGPVDAAVCGPGFVATMRAWVSPEQATLIAQAGASEAVILFDGDEAGENGAARSFPILNAALPTRIAACPEGEDPGSLGRLQALQAATAASGGGIQQLRTTRYIQIAKPARRPPLQEPLDHLKGPPKEK